MPVHINRPATIDITKVNPRATVYFSDGTFTANETTNSSIRFLYDPSDGMLVIRKRLDGVWNDDGLRVSSGSLELGLDLSIGAAASFIETFNEAIFDAHQKALIPHIPFDDVGTKNVHTPILDIVNTDIIFSSAFSETTGTSIAISFTTDHARFVSTIFHEVGATGASTQVQYSIYAGTDNTGVLIKRKNLPSSDLVANTTLTVEFKSITGDRPNYVGFNDGSDFFIELTSASSFSLKTDVSGNPLMSFIEQHQDVLDIVTNNLMTNIDGEIMFNSENRTMFAGQFR